MKELEEKPKKKIVIGLSKMIMIPSFSNMKRSCCGRSISKNTLTPPSNMMEMHTMN